MKALHIGIDGNPLSQSLTGIGRYVYELILYLSQAIPEATFFVYSKDPIISEIEFPKNCILVCEESWIFRRLNKSLWVKFRLFHHALKNKLEIFWAPSFVLPNWLSKETKTILTIHDLVVELYPKTVKLSQRIRNKIFFQKDLRTCNILITISQGTSDRLYLRYGRSADLIVRPPISKLFTSYFLSSHQPKLSELDISAPYFLSVATMEPRKNLEILLDVFKFIKINDVFSTYKLVLVGSEGWKNKKLRKKIAQFREIGVINLGYIPDHYLPLLYSNAEIFIFPSIYEGYGMPVAEAIACGAKVLASDVPEIREAGGSWATYVEPTIDNLVKAVFNNRFISENRKSTPEVPEKISQDWRKDASRFADLIKELAQ